VHYRDATASSFVANVRVEFLTHFHAVAVKRRSSMRIDCLARQDEFILNNPLHFEEDDEHALDFALHLSRFLFDLGEFGLFHWEDCYFVLGS
jgi:hypothetical protein